MSDRWLNIYHIYHASITCQILTERSKSFLLFGDSLPTAVAMNAQVVKPSLCQLLMHRKSAISIS